LDGTPNTGIRWITLRANGANVEDVDRLWRLVLASGARPRYVVLGLHSDMLADNFVFLTDQEPLEIQPVGNRGRLRGAYLEVGRLAGAAIERVLPQAKRVKYRIEAAVENARRRLNVIPGASMQALFPPVRDPWASQLTLFRGARTKDQVVSDLARAGKTFGFMDAAAYSATAYKVQLLDQLLSDIHSEGFLLYVVVLPKRSQARAVFPPIGRELLRDVLAKHGELSGRILDLHESVPDEDFSDGAHLAPNGRRELSMKLAAFLR
jgi:hypothetical protein